jgi:putative sigma-54 modulation protein
LQIEVTVRHASIDEELKDYAKDKASHLPRYYDKVQGIHVVLDSTKAGFECEMIARIARMHELVARTTADDLRAAIDQTVDRLERQLTQHKDRIRNRKGRGPNPHQPTRT